MLDRPREKLSVVISQVLETGSGCAHGAEVHNCAICSCLVLFLTVGLFKINTSWPKKPLELVLAAGGVC